MLDAVPISDQRVAVEHAVRKRPTNERNLKPNRLDRLNRPRPNNAIVTTPDLDDMPRDARRLAGDPIRLRWFGG